MTPPLGPDDREASGTQMKTVGSGRYELGRQLGRGGMAEVLMAHDVRLGRTVAVKTLRPDLAQDPVARSRFGREAQNAASLNHPAIVSVYDTGEDRVGGELVPFIVMECVEGRTVRELLGDGTPIPLEQALRITEGILEALEYSHHHGIIHRDIKPANVIITNSGAVKVMDFGIARAMHSAATTMTQTGMVMGTPQYLSPEQALGRTVDARSDLYSSGCLFYELLALRPPFNGDTPLSVVYQHVQDDPRPPSMADPRVPPHLDAIALKALAKNPDDRYQTADEMRMDIRRALAGQQVSVTVPQRVPAQNQRPSFASWDQTAAPGQFGTAEATAAMPALTNPTVPQQAPPGGNGDGTGRLPVVPPGSGPAKRRRVPLYLFAVLAVLLVILGTILIARADDDTEGGTTKTPVTATQTPPASNGAQPQPDDTQPTTQESLDQGNSNDNDDRNWNNNPRQDDPNPPDPRPSNTASATGQTGGQQTSTALPSETATSEPSGPPVTSEPSKTDAPEPTGGNSGPPPSDPPGNTTTGGGGASPDTPENPKGGTTKP